MQAFRPMRFVPTALLALSLLASTAASARTLDTGYGAVEIDGQPERVVTLYEGALDAALAAGVQPLAAVTTRGADGVASYIQDQAGDLAIVGVVREINLEAVVAQRPDLILASPQLPREQYQLLSRIAPTVVPKTQTLGPDTWKEEARLFAQALDREQEIEDAIAAVEQRAAKLAETVEQNFAEDKTTYLVRWMPQGALIMSSQLFSTGLLSAAGFGVQDGDLVKAGRPHSDPLSLENLSQVDGDWLFLATLNEDGRKALEAAKQSPAFARLNVVEQERVVPVDGQLWTSASGPIAAQAILDQLESVIERYESTAEGR